MDKILDWQGLGAVITAVGVILLGVLVPIVNSRQKRKEAQWNLLLRHQERELELKLNRIEESGHKRLCRESALLSDIYARLYGYIWKLLFDIDADRVFILQPHPLSNKKFISASFEVLHPNKDMKSHKEFKFKKMDEWAGLVSRLGKDEWLIYRSIDDIRDPKTYAEAHRRGVKTWIFKRLVDEHGYWEGTLCAEYKHSRPEDLAVIKGAMARKAFLIQDILPEYNPQ